MTMFEPTVRIPGDAEGHTTSSGEYFDDYDEACKRQRELDLRHDLSRLDTDCTNITEFVLAHKHQLFAILASQKDREERPLYEEAAQSGEQDPDEDA